MAEITNKLGKYTLVEQLGSGAFGWVYKATDNIGRTVAIKVLKPGWSDDPNTIERFRREAQVAGELFHSRIATILDFDESDGRLFLVMRYIDGISLEKLIQQKGRLPWARTLEILGQVAEGLDFAHQRGFVHRDIKPANILISEKEGAVLTDFGLVKAAEASGVSSSGAFLGTPNYIAPEIWSGKPASSATDVYSLACVACEMLTGKVLFVGENTPEIITKHIMAAPQLPERWPEDVPQGFGQVLAQTLTKDPAERQNKALAFVAELKKLTEVGQQQAEVLEKARREAEKQAEQDRQAAQAKAEAEIAEKARRAAEQRAQDAKNAQLEMERKARESEQARSEQRSPNGTPEKSLLARFWPAGLLLLGVMLAIFLLGRSSGGSTPAAPAPATALRMMATDKPTLALPTRTQTPLPTLAPTQTLVPEPKLGIGSTQTREKDDMVMVSVPAGPFTMGSDNSQDNAKPVHTVTLDAFWIDQTEVTNGKYALCVKEGFCQPPDDNKSANQSSYYGNAEFIDYPRIYVDWDQAQTYCEWAGARLPTEAEWEKAARGVDWRTYPWGEGIDKTYGNYGQNDGDTTKVGSYKKGQSPYGVYDMAGNVWEWVNDWYGETYYQDSPSRNPTGPASGTYRVLRGGAWGLTDVRNIRSANRVWDVPIVKYINIGFRCAVSQ